MLKKAGSDDLLGPADPRHPELGQPGSQPIEYVMHQLTRPFLAPIRRILPALGGLDLSVLVAFIALQAINYLLGICSVSCGG